MCPSHKVEKKVDNFFSSSVNHIFGNFFKRTFYCRHTQTVRAFDLIPTLRNRPECQLSADIHSHKAGTKLPHTLAYTVCGRDLKKKSTTFGYVQPWWTTLKVVTAVWPKIAWFWELWNILEDQDFYTTSTIHCYPQIYKHFFFKPWYSILFLYTFKSCYKIMVLNSAQLCIGWNISAPLCLPMSAFALPPLHSLSANVDICLTPPLHSSAIVSILQTPPPTFRRWHDLWTGPYWSSHLNRL